jgi:DNA ligase-1
VRVLEQERCRGVAHLGEELARIDALGGEGLMVRQPDSHYEAGRSSTLLKIKRFHDAEARVIGHLPGAGRHKGRLGALDVELPDGTPFSVGTGFSDAQRENPPAVGSVITFRYQELSDRGVPRFPSFVRARRDAESQPVLIEAATPLPSAPSAAKITIMTNTRIKEQPMKRRFEFVEGNSAKFWEISTNGADVSVTFGRLGTNGQTQTKTLPDAEAAAKHVDKLIGEKTKKGYQEVAGV